MTVLVVVVLQNSTFREGRFDRLSGSHLQSQEGNNCQVRQFIWFVQSSFVYVIAGVHMQVYVGVKRCSIVH